MKSFDLVSGNHLWPILTTRPWCLRKSAPRIELRTLAMMNTHRKILRRRRFRVSERVPYVTTGEPFAASRPNVSCPFLFSVIERCIMLISALVSMRKRSLDSRSVTYNSDLFVGQPRWSPLKTGQVISRRTRRRHFRAVSPNHWWYSTCCLDLLPGLLVNLK